MKIVFLKTIFHQRKTSKYSKIFFSELEESSIPCTCPKSIPTDINSSCVESTSAAPDHSNGGSEESHTLDSLNGGGDEPRVVDSSNGGGKELHRDVFCEIQDTLSENRENSQLEDSIKEIEQEIRNNLDDHFDDAHVEFEYDWDDDHTDDTIQVNSIKIRYNHFGDFDKNIFTAHQNQHLTYTQALSGPDAEKWQLAIQKELNAMERYEVWNIVPKPKDRQVIPLKWVFSIKSNGTYKARLVAVGCRDKNKASELETASPTPLATTIRWLFILASNYGWDMRQIDFENAFLSGNIDREKYVSIPQGIDKDSKKFACKLKKALYGLDIAPICFNQELDSFLKSLGFIRNLRQPCIYTKRDIGGITLVLTFVDDLILTGINQAEEAFLRCYEVKNLGFPKTFVGITIEKCENQLFLHQEAYAKEVVKQYYTADNSDLQVSKWSRIPMPPLSDHKKMATLKEENFPYRQVIGALIYLANYTRPDLSFSIHYLARFQTRPTALHWTLAQCILPVSYTHLTLPTIYPV